MVERPGILRRIRRLRGNQQSRCPRVCGQRRMVHYLQSLGRQEDWLHFLLSSSARLSQSLRDWIPNKAGRKEKRLRDRSGTVACRLSLCNKEGNRKNRGGD